MLSALKRWDLSASRQPDYYIANSRVVAPGLKGSTAAMPGNSPTDRHRQVRAFRKSGDTTWCCRVDAIQRIDLAIEACNKLQRRLVIIGEGPDRKRLEKLAGPTVRFLGRQPDSVVARRAGRCRALLFPGEEDFGMSPLEVNAAGRPVIAYNAGGAIET